MLQNSFGHTIERRCRCESRTIRNKEFCADWFVWWNLLGRVWYFLHIFIHGGGPEFPLPFAFGSWERGCMGQCVRIVCMGLLSILIAFLYKAFLQSLKDYSGIIYGLFWWALLCFGDGFNGSCY